MRHGNTYFGIVQAGPVEIPEVRPEVPPFYRPRPPGSRSRFPEAQGLSLIQSPPAVDKKVSSIAIGMDGTTMFLCQDGYREAMVGTIALYDKEGKRQHINYLAATPEHGKERFLARLEGEIAHIKADFPDAYYVGLADGAKCNWTFLEKHTDTQTIDFWHATEYLAKAAGVMFRGKRQMQAKADWLDQACYKLKHTVGEATRL